MHKISMRNHEDTPHESVVRSPEAVQAFSECLLLLSLTCADIAERTCCGDIRSAMRLLQMELSTRSVQCVAAFTVWTFLSSLGSGAG